MLQVKNLRGDFALEAGNRYNEHADFEDVVLRFKIDTQRAMLFQTSGSIHDACDIISSLMFKKYGCKV